jgi:hypothetical protein
MKLNEIKKGQVFYIAEQHEGQLYVVEYIVVSEPTLVAHNYFGFCGRNNISQAKRDVYFDLVDGEEVVASPMADYSTFFFNKQDAYNYALDIAQKWILTAEDNIRQKQLEVVQAKNNLKRYKTMLKRIEKENKELLEET